MVAADVSVQKSPYVEGHCVESFEVRGMVYAILRQFFFEEPQHDFLASCRDCDVFNHIPYQCESAHIASGVALIREYFDTCDPVSDPDALSNLHWDFTKLFIGPLPPTAPPWASYYLEKDRLLFQKTTLDVRQRYQKYRYVAGSHINEQADDHIALELEFLQVLNEKCLNEIKTGHDEAAIASLLHDQQDFIQGHLMEYAHSFATTVERHATFDFYKGLAFIAAGFLEKDLGFLNKILAQKTVRKEIEKRGRYVR